MTISDTISELPREELEILYLEELVAKLGFELKANRLTKEVKSLKRKANRKG